MDLDARKIAAGRCDLAVAERMRGQADQHDFAGYGGGRHAMGDEVGDRIGGKRAGRPAEIDQHPPDLVHRNFFIAERDLAHAVGADHQAKRRVLEISRGQRQV